MKILSLLLCFTLLFSTVAPVEAKEDREAILSALYESDIATASQALDQGLITCVELTRYFLDRIETYNEAHNCFITLCDNALEEAAKRDALLAQGGQHSMLLGIPIVVKDNIAYEGYPTTNGLWKYGSVSWENATIVQTLLDAGAVILGKSNMSTEAQAAEYTASDAIGETPNAYSLDLSAGGSSGGSAVAVSLNFCYAGLGTDTNASLRYPAVLNGCISLRPTKGLLDREGIQILNGTRDVPGVITRSVEDQAIVLGEMTGTDYFSSLDEKAFEGKRIGVLLELCYDETSQVYRSPSKIDQEIKTVFHEAVDHIRDLGATVIPVSIPDLFSLAARCEYNSSTAISYYLSVYEELFAERKLDAVIFPTYLHTPDDSLKKSGWAGFDHNHFYSNCSLLSSPLGVPEIAIPIGYHSKGSGIGLEIAGLKEQEALLLNLAYAYTKEYDTRRIPETAPNQYPGTKNLRELLPSEEEATVPTEVPTVTEQETLPVTEPLPEESVYTESIAETKEEDLSSSEFPTITVILILALIVPVSAWGIYRKRSRKKAVK